jgi:MFS transporter, Spinster family, sphingosine-1-phosphate transporter
VAGYAAVTFAAGALGDWFSVFLQRYHGMSIKESGWWVGASMVVGGLGGTMAGGLLGDLCKRWTRHPYLALSGWSMMVATICGIMALLLKNSTAVIVMLFLAQFFLWCYNGPVNAILANSVSSVLRARAFAFAILLIHLFGDAVGPDIVGLASDGVGLAIAIQLIPLAMGTGAIIWLWGWRKLPEDFLREPSNKETHSC